MLTSGGQKVKTGRSAEVRGQQQQKQSHFFGLNVVENLWNSNVKSQERLDNSLLRSDEHKDLHLELE